MRTLDLDIYGCFTVIGHRGVDVAHLAQNEDLWNVLVIRTFLFSKNVGEGEVMTS